MPASGRVQGIDVAEVAHRCVGHITALVGDCILPLSTGLVQQGGQGMLLRHTSFRLHFRLWDIMHSLAVPWSLG